MKLKRYSEYKDSGLFWLGDVPAHWDVKRAKNVFKCIDQRSKTGNEELLTVSSNDGVRPRKEKKVTMFMAESYVGHKLCWPGDLVINSLWAWMKGLGFSRHHGIISSAYGVYRPKKEYSEMWGYFDFLIRSEVYDFELRDRSKGIWISRLQLTDESFLEIPIVLPPAEEAAQIHEFLNKVNTLIKNLILRKQKQIALLNEQKQAIIHRAVTRGLDPDVKLKESGLEWLGKIPEHWQIMQFGRLIRKIEQGWSPLAAEGDVEKDQWAVLTLSAVKKGKFFPEANKPLPQSLDIPKQFEVLKNDFLITRANTKNLVGDTCIVESTREKLMLCDLIYRLRFNKSPVNQHFIKYQLLSPMGRLQIESDARGSNHTMVKLSQGHIKRWFLALPPLEEQTKIVNSIELALAPLELATNRISDEIGLIQEYRTRLIADVVTGKLDVRDVVLPMTDDNLTDLETDLEPDEIPELELVDAL